MNERTKTNICAAVGWLFIAGFVLAVWQAGKDIAEATGRSLPREISP